MVESKQQWKAWLYLSPAIILLLIFTVWPIFNTLRMAFLEDYSGLEAVGGRTFEFGIGNFTKVIKYKNFLKCLKNTVFICVPTVLISSFLALLIAVCLNSIKPLQKLLQTIFFLPYVTNSIAIGMVFAAMFNIVGNLGTKGNDIIVTAGIINNIIEFFGGHAVNWINAGSTYAANFTVMVIYIVWNALPFKILILLGGLQSINKQYVEAAEGGYRFYIMAGEAKTYIDIYEYNTGKAGIRLTTEPTAVYTWNEELHILVAVNVAGEDRYLGTYNTYNTISASSTSYITGDNASKIGVSQFPAYLVTIGIG